MFNLASWISENWFEAHYGAIEVNGRLVAFSNSGTDPRKLADLFGWLAEEGYTVEHVSTFDGSWAVVATPPANWEPDLDAAERIVWAGSNFYQRSIAGAVTADGFPDDVVVAARLED